VTYSDPGDDPILEPAPGAVNLWERVRLVALMDPEAANLESLRRSLGERLGCDPPGWTVERLEDRLWERAWMDHFTPMRFGADLWVVPSHMEPPEPGAVNLRLDPGLAFGTGTHPTTALCLEWLAENPPRGFEVIDYGCGSGILAVAALKLGAARVHGVDNDPQALEASRTNARANDVAGGLRLSGPDEPDPPAADLVLANILANVLIELQPRLSRATRPGGQIVLSGILNDQAGSVMAAFEDDFILEPPLQREDWVCITGMRRR
jgi:ribosomal protein L11 methyltransferase